MDINRRNFLKGTSVTVVGIVVPSFAIVKADNLMRCKPDKTFCLPFGRVEKFPPLFAKNNRRVILLPSNSSSWDRILSANIERPPFPNKPISEWPDYYVSRSMTGTTIASVDGTFPKTEFRFL